MPSPYQAEIDRAVAESDAACKAATENTPEKYRSFLYFMVQSKRFGPPKSNVYAKIRVPGIQAEGRILWARDDHVSRDERLDIETSFASDGEQLICKALATSSYRGSATGHSVVKPGTSGIEAEYPKEKAETTAISRALGFLGYGILDTGMSAEDLVSDAEEGDVDANARTDEGSPATNPAQGDSASDKQMGLLYAELARCGVAEGEKRNLVSALYDDGMTKADASKEITALKLRNILPRNWLKQYLRMLCERQGLSISAMNAYIKDIMRIENFDKMLRQQQDDLIEWVANWRIPEPETTPGPALVEEPDDIPDNIYRPGEPVNPETQTLADEWTEVIGTIGEANPGFAREDIVAWLLDEIGGGEYQDVYSIEKRKLERLQRMNPAMVTKAIAAHVEHRQPSLPL